MYCQTADLDLWVRVATTAPIHVLGEKLMHFRWDTRKRDQISSATKEKTVRTFNEEMMIRRDLIERLTDEQFILFFGDKFKNELSRNHLEIEFEKAFLLAECISEASELKVLGIQKLEQVLKMPGAMETLREHFGMHIHEIYMWNGCSMYNEPWLRDTWLTECEEQKRQMTAEYEEQKRQIIAEYENSKSWKITAPMRKLIRKVKRKY